MQFIILLTPTLSFSLYYPAGCLQIENMKRVNKVQHCDMLAHRPNIVNLLKISWHTDFGCLIIWNCFKEKLITCGETGWPPT